MQRYGSRHCNAPVAQLDRALPSEGRGVGCAIIPPPRTSKLLENLRFPNPTFAGLQ